MEEIILFTPIGAGGEVEVTSTAATVAIGKGNAPANPQTIRFVNYGGQPCRVRFATAPLTPGDEWVQAAVTDTTGFVLMPGIVEVFRTLGAPSFNVKTESGATDLNWQLGSGA
jgi:hypothetical protein